MSRRTTARVLGVGASLVGLLSLTGCLAPIAFVEGLADGTADGLASYSPTPRPTATPTPSGAFKSDEEALKAVIEAAARGAEKSAELINNPDLSTDEMAEVASGSYLEVATATIEQYRSQNVRYDGAVSFEGVELLKSEQDSSGVRLKAYLCVDRSLTAAVYPDGERVEPDPSVHRKLMEAVVQGETVDSLKVESMSGFGPEFPC